MTVMEKILFVGLGGAMGAICRYLISMIPLDVDFPMLTMVTNILGAVLIGFVVGMAAGHDELSPNVVLFWKTGVCGGFTTFSTFSLEAFNLLEAGRTLAAVSYMLLSVVCCLIGVVAGMTLAKKIG